MGLDLNLGDVESWNLGGSGAMPDGWFVALVQDAEEGVSGAGNPKIEFTFQVCAGEFSGRERWDTLPILPPDPANGRKGNLGRVRGTLEAMGRAIPKGNFVLDAETLKGARVGILLASELDEYQGETRVRQRVKGYKPAADVEVDVDLKPRDDLYAKVNGASGASTGGTTSSSSAPLDDDDIPF